MKIRTFQTKFPYDAKKLELAAEIYNTEDETKRVKVSSIILDTGASGSLINSNILRNLGINLTPDGGKSIGIEGKIISNDAGIYGVKFSDDFFFNCKMRANETLPVDMLLGMDILSQLHRWEIKRDGLNDIEVYFEMHTDENE